MDVCLFYSFFSDVCTMESPKNTLDVSELARGGFRRVAILPALCISLNS